MIGFFPFLIVYVLGGLTFIPLILIALFFHAYLTLPTYSSDNDAAARDLFRHGDDRDAIKSAQKNLGEKFQLRKGSYEADVAAGYFAVCREYVPGGVNGKPPERTTPTGNTTIGAPSPSVYQNIYRSVGSVFEKKTASPIDNKAAPRKGGNVFYVVLRHGHILLFDDQDMLEVRHVISLSHHDVSIYSGGEHIPEGELFIKRNALCLSRKLDAGEITADGSPSKPFYLFSENCSEKEDFYFALLRNQERKHTKDDPPIPLLYNVGDLIGLVQRLHSSEEFLQTRWINALLGRLFLALYKTSEVENFVRAKITKKIARVKTPSFLSGIVLKHVDMGEGAPYITNPRLKDLTVDGECVVEADFKYMGSARLEVAATAKIELGSRFKARTVDLVLAVVLKRLEGHLLVRMKPPPSNRVWISFETMPKIDLDISPIVSSRAITYNLILRQIESRIKEVIAESVVLPNWDDSPFHHTDHKKWRGGIWADENVAAPSDKDREDELAEKGEVDELQNFEGEVDHEKNEKGENQAPGEGPMSVPAFASSNPQASSTFSRKAAKSAFNLGISRPSASSTSVDSRPGTSDSSKPMPRRVASFASASSPVVHTDVTNADAFKESRSSDRSDAASAMAALSARSDRSTSNTPAATPVGSPSKASVLSEKTKTGSFSSVSSDHSKNSDKGAGSYLTPQPTPSSVDTTYGPRGISHPPSPASVSTESIKSEAGRSFGYDNRQDTSSTSSSKSGNGQEKKLSLAAMTSAAAQAKKWGFDAIKRHTDSRSSSENTEKHSEPMGRGRPLPPPGTPLPPPDRKTKTAPIPVPLPKRKPVSAPSLPRRPQETDTEHESEYINPALQAAQLATKSESGPDSKRKAPPPPLPRRQGNEPSSTAAAGSYGSILVVAAPPDSEPSTPLEDCSQQEYMQPWADDEVDEDLPSRQPSLKSHGGAGITPPRLPNRTPLSKSPGKSPEEDENEVGSWTAAQESEARVRNMMLDEETGSH